MCLENYKMIKTVMQEVMQDHRNEMKKMHEAMQEQFRRALQEQQNVIMGALWKLRENQQQLLELLKQDVPPLQNSKDQDDLEDLQQPQFQKPQPVLQFQQQLHPQYQIQQQQMGPDDEQQPKRKRGGAKKRRLLPSVYGVPPDRMWLNQNIMKQYLPNQQQQLFYQQQQQVFQEDEDVQQVLVKN